jgi:hypothetical protein
MVVAPSDAPLPQGAPDQATVVFIRPSSFAFSVKFQLVDHVGRFVGELPPRSYFVARMPPGEYVFILGSEHIDVLYANVAPGIVYYVDVVPTPGSFEERAILRPVRPGEREWKALGRTFLRNTQLIPDLAHGQAELTRDPSLRARIDRAKRMWANLSPDERPLHSLAPNEGAATEPIASYSPAPPPWGPAPPALPTAPGP